MELQPEVYDVLCVRTVRLSYLSGCSRSYGWILHQSLSLDGEEERCCIEKRTRSWHLRPSSLRSSVVLPARANAKRSLGEAATKLAITKYARWHVSHAADDGRQ